VTTSCASIGTSAQAAKYNRHNYYAMDDLLGCAAIFMTVTPDDEVSFRVRLYANAKEEVSK